MNKILRILLIFPGLFFEILNISKNGSRNLTNKLIYRGAKIGLGANITSNTVINHDAHIFRNVTLVNCEIDSYSYIGTSCFLENVKVGRFCSIAKHTLIGLGTHPKHMISTSPIFYKKINPLGITLVKKDMEIVEYEAIEIGHDVWIGARTTIMDGVKIGTGAIIASGAIVTKDVPPYAIVAGVPAKLIKYRFDKDIIDKLLQSKWWEWNLSKINQHKDLAIIQHDFNNV